MALSIVMLAFLVAGVFLVDHFHRVRNKIGLPNNTGCATLDQPSCIVVPMNSDSMHDTKSEFKKFVMSQYKLPWDVLGLSRESMHNMAVVTRRFYDLFEAAKKGDSDSLDLQTLCSSFFLLHLINTTKSNTTNVINNNLTVQASHITVTQELVGLRSELAQRNGQLEQWACAWEESMAEIQSRYEDQSNTIRELEAQLVLMRERAKCAPPFFDALNMFLRLNCITGDNERVGSAELHSAFSDFCVHNCLGEPPNQREVRALLETLGFKYDQVYLRGNNTRGFRGLGIKPGSA